MLTRNHWIVVGLLWLVLGSMVVFRSRQRTTRNFYSLTERRMPCGRIQRREVIHENDAWRKTITILDAHGRTLASKTRTIEPEQCAHIQTGKFVPGLWKDCSIPI
jgi:hypothetical protein